MRSKGFDGMVCSIAGVMAAIGDRWAVLILRDLLCGLSRYEDFRHSSGVTNATLSDRLKHLEANGLVERRRYQHPPAPLPPLVPFFLRRQHLRASRLATSSWEELAPQRVRHTRKRLK